MREALFIFAVIIVLLAWTAFRYRRQISGVLEFTRELKKVRGSLSSRRPAAEVSTKGDTALVNCSVCGVWTPGARARHIKGKAYCSDECLATCVS